MDRNPDAMLKFNTTFAPVLKTEENNVEIYSELGNKTVSENVVIKSVYQQEGVQYAKSIGGIFSLRVNNSDKHFGNPFTNDQRLVDRDNLIKTNSTKESVEKYINWIINSNDSRAEWIREQLKSNKLKGKPIIYYKELGEPSHATALDYLINKYNWTIQQQNYTNRPIAFGNYLIKNLYKEFADIKNNPNYKDLFRQYLLLDRLFVSSEEEVKNIGLSYFNKDSQLQDTYIEQFKELLNNPDLEIRNFMLKFAYMSFYQSGLNKSFISSTDILPVPILSGILEDVREQYLKEFDTPIKKLNLLDSFYNKMQGNNEFMRTKESRKSSNNITKVSSYRGKNYRDNIDALLMQPVNTSTQQATNQPAVKEDKKNNLSVIKKELTENVIFFPQQFTTVAYDKTIGKWLLKIDERAAISDEREFQKDGWTYSYADWMGIQEEGDIDKRWTKYRIQSINGKLKSETIVITEKEYTEAKDYLDDNPFSVKELTFEQAKEYWERYKKSQQRQSPVEENKQEITKEDTDKLPPCIGQ